MKKLLLTTLLVLSAGCAGQTPQPARAQTAPDAAQLYAWYREDGIQSRGNAVTSWSNSGTEAKRALSQVVGRPQIARVQTPGGEKAVVNFNGSSSLWQRLDQWGEIKGDVTIIALTRLTRADAGFLFDGSTGVGLTRAQVRKNKWQIGTQAVTASAAGVAGNADIDTMDAKIDQWQSHAFVFRKDALQATHTLDGESKTVTLKANSPLSGFIVGANGGAKDNLRVQIAEILLYNRALPAQEVTRTFQYLTDKWGALEAVAGADAAHVGDIDKTAIAERLADKAKPLIWLFSGHSAQEKNLNGARDQSENFAERVRWEMNRRRDIIIDTRSAVPGSLESNFTARVTRFHPDIVVLKLGPGDDAAALIEKVRQLKAIPILQSGAAQAAAWRKIATDHDVLLVETPPLAAGGNATAAQIEVNDALALMRALNIDDGKSSLHKLLKN